MDNLYRLQNENTTKRMKSFLVERLACDELIYNELLLVLELFSVWGMEYYERYSEREISFKKQYYERMIYPFGNSSTDCFRLEWYIPKAENLIKKKKIKKEYVELKNMHVSEKELIPKHFKEAIHNKKPAILVSYLPYEKNEFYNFIIDGSHRVTDKKINKNIISHAAYILDPVSTVKAFSDKYIGLHFLLHLLFVLFQNIHDLSRTEVMNRTIKYIRMKDILLNEHCNEINEQDFYLHV